MWADQRKVYFIFHKVASVLYGKYSTVMQIIVVVISVKFQMLIAVTNWFQMKFIVKCIKSNSFCYLPLYSCVWKACYNHWNLFIRVMVHWSIWPEGPEAEYASFTPNMMSTMGGFSSRDDHFLQKACFTIFTSKWDKDYSVVMGWLHCSLSFSLCGLPSRVCMHGPHSSIGHFHRAPPPLDLIRM